MEVLISCSALPQSQKLVSDWYANRLAVPYCFSFAYRDGRLVFKASRSAPALLHPDARCGAFQAELWRYDAAEFFIATVDASRYMEFNLAPNGAWWACVFSAPRVVDPAASVPEAVRCSGELRADGWQAEASIPADFLLEQGINPACCRLAAAAILESPQQIFLTSAEDLSGEPDFHRPLTWPMARLV